MPSISPAPLVVRIVLCFDLLESPVILAVCRRDRVAGLVVIQVIYIPAGRDERVHSRIGLPDPRGAPGPYLGNPSLRGAQEALAPPSLRKDRIGGGPPRRRARDGLQP